MTDLIVLLCCAAAVYLSLRRLLYMRCWHKRIHIQLQRCCNCGMTVREIKCLQYRHGIKSCSKPELVYGDLPYPLSGLGRIQWNLTVEPVNNPNSPYLIKERIVAAPSNTPEQIALWERMRELNNGYTLYDLAERSA